MKIRRIFNNNSILAIDQNGEEKVLFGKGIGFKANVGDNVDSKKVEKTFVYKNEEANSRLKNLINDVPSDIVSLAFDIVDYCKNNIKTPMSDYLYVTLTDHLNMAFKLHNQGHVSPNLIMWEIKRFYPKEYKLGLKVLEYIYEETGKKLDEFEAGHIALHLINAQLNTSESTTKNDVLNITKKINEIMNVIKYNLNVELDNTTFEYERFVFHLRHFLTRINKPNKKEHSINKFIFEQVIEEYPKEYECVKKIQTYLGQKLDIDEKLYLTMHIARVVNTN